MLKMTKWGQNLMFSIPLKYFSKSWKTKWQNFDFFCRKYENFWTSMPDDTFTPFSMDFISFHFTIFKIPLKIKKCIEFQKWSPYIKFLGFFQFFPHLILTIRNQSIKIIKSSKPKINHWYSSSIDDTSQQQSPKN